MQTSIGSTGITTSVLALGCARIGSTLTALNRRQSLALIDEAYELGVRHFDTASIYGQGDSERYLGEALRKRRGGVCLASKAGQRLTPRQALLAHFKTPIRMFAARRSAFRERVAEQRARALPHCFDADYIARSLDATLRRLRVEHLDVFYLHSPDASVLADERLIDRIGALQRTGRFRAFGVSCDEPEVARVAAALESVQVVQLALEDTSESRDVLNVLAARGKTAIVRGLVARAAPASDPGVPLAERFARALTLPAVGGIIVGTTNVAHLRENIAALASTTRRGMGNAAAR